MRLLYLTWVDPNDPMQRGGGLSVYQRALIEGFSRCDGVQVGLLTSGLAHDLRRGPPRIEAVAPGHWHVVNSGLLAPSHADFASFAQISHPATEAIVAAFVRDTGPWDVIHVNTLEGLPARVLAILRQDPRTRVVMSLHNYYPFCPQVNLWHQEREACTDFRGGAACATCLPVTPNPRPIRQAYAIEHQMQRWHLGPGSAVFDRVARPAMRLGWGAARRLMRLRRKRAPLAAPGAPFAARRAEMVALMNTHCDAVLCVSDRVRQIVEGFGVLPTRLTVLRIGSDQATYWSRTRPRAAFLKDDGTLHLAYLGYMRRDKGFFWLMQALAALPDDLSRRLYLTVAARRGDAAAMDAMAALAPRLAGLHHVDGYARDGLDTLLADVDLGIVPVLWEDNLPQVALEMHARHIPLLVSDRGGAGELGQCPALTFAAGDIAALHAALARVLDGSVTPAHYWDNAIAPVTIAQHLDALLGVYRG